MTLVHPKLGWLAGECIDRDPTGYLQHHALKAKELAHALEDERDAYRNALHVIASPNRATYEKLGDAVEIARDALDHPERYMLARLPVIVDET